MMRPPLTCIVSPVMYDAKSEARNATAAPMSSGSPNRARGIPDSKVFLSSSVIKGRTMSVAMNPGATAFTRILYGAVSRARLLVNPMMPDLVEA